MRNERSESKVNFIYVNKSHAELKITRVLLQFQLQ